MNTIRKDDLLKLYNAHACSTYRNSISKYLNKYQTKDFDFLIPIEDLDIIYAKQSATKAQKESISEYLDLTQTFNINAIVPNEDIIKTQTVKELSDALFEHKDNYIEMVRAAWNMLPGNRSDLEQRALYVSGSLEVIVYELEYSSSIIEFKLRENEVENIDGYIKPNINIINKTMDRKQIILLVAQEMLKINNTLTTLELKVELRTRYPEMYWKQDFISQIMSEYEEQGIFEFIDNGTYRIYSKITSSTHVPKPFPPIVSPPVPSSVFPSITPFITNLTDGTTTPVLPSTMTGSTLVATTPAIIDDVIPVKKVKKKPAKIEKLDVPISTIVKIIKDNPHKVIGLVYTKEKTGETKTYNLRYTGKNSLLGHLMMIKTNFENPDESREPQAFIIKNIKELRFNRKRYVLKK